MSTPRQASMIVALFVPIVMTAGCSEKTFPECPCEVNGFVTDIGTDKTFANAEIVMAGRTVYSDAQGFYRLRGLSQGRHEYTVTPDVADATSYWATSSQIAVYENYQDYVDLPLYFKYFVAPPRKFSIEFESGSLPATCGGTPTRLLFRCCCSTPGCPSRSDVNCAYFSDNGTIQGRHSMIHHPLGYVSNPISGCPLTIREMRSGRITATVGGVERDFTACDVGTTSCNDVVWESAPLACN